MKLINYCLIFFFFFGIIGCGGKHETISINTPTIQCGMCQKTIEIGLKKIKGINNSKVDLATKKTMVTYNLDKTDLNKIEKAISDLGYKANDKLSDPNAYEKLPVCCKIGGMDH